MRRSAWGTPGSGPGRPCPPFFEVLAAEAEKDFDPIELVYPGEVPYFERYDEFIPEELVRKGFAEGVLDIEGMKQRVLSWRDHA